LTGSYKAEFGHGSGGVINVVSQSGTNDRHGGVSFFHRNYKLDSSNSSNVLNGEVPFLLRWDPSAQLGGPILRDKIFFFGSAERILESRQLNFQFPPTTPPILVQLGTPYNLHTKIYDTRARAKLDEQLGHHRLSQQFNLTNTHLTDYLPLLAALSLPSLMARGLCRSVYARDEVRPTHGNAKPLRRPSKMTRSAGCSAN
jgi:hypothetical protein